MKLWQRDTEIQKNIERFTVGKDRELDRVLAKYDVIGSIAHAKMLHSIGILTQCEFSDLLCALENIQQEVSDENFEIDTAFEDIHSYVEYMLTQKLDLTGKKIHTGRSRNDQILVDMHLFLKEELSIIMGQVIKLFDTLINLSEQHKADFLPGYTHLQVAMLSSYGMWFGAYAETLIDDVYLFEAVYKTINQNPLGSAAGYGTSLPLDRKLTTKLLGFKTLKYNALAAQMSRGRIERAFSFAMSSLSNTLSKFSMDICLYMSQNFGFITFPDELTTGSSIMPHKKNPDVFELIRAKCNRIQSLPTEITMLINNLPSGYHRDYQMLKDILLPSIDSLKSCLDITIFMLQYIIIKKVDLTQEKYKYLFSVELVNKEVMRGLPFREAYKKVRKTIQQKDFNPEIEIHHTHEGSIGNLCNHEIKEKMTAALQFINQ